jgi:hypothetical protein
MSSPAPPKRHARIDASELNWVEVCDDGQRLRLHLRDRQGRPASLSLPVECVNTVLAAVPRSPAQLLADAREQAYALDGWSLGRDERGLVLTLHCPDGARIAFAVHAWQIAAIASLVGHERAAPPRRRVH